MIGLARSINVAFETLILHTRLIQRLLHLLLAGVGVCQFLVGLDQGTGILVNSPGLFLLLGVQEDEPCLCSLDGFLKVANPCAGQYEGALRFFDLLVNGSQIPAEVIAVQ